MATKKTENTKKTKAKNLTSGKKAAKATSAGSTPLVAGTEPKQRSLDDLLSELPERAAKGELKPDEINRVHDWFNAYIDGLVDDILAIDNIVGSAPVGELQGLSDRRLELSTKKTDAEQKQNAFDTANTMLRPPSQDLIQRTQDLTKEMANVIAQEKKAQATLKFVNDLAAIFVKLTT